MTPENLTAVIVGLIVTNLSTVGTAIVFVVKQILWLAKLEFRTEGTEKDINALFDRVRAIESKLMK